MPVPHAVPQAPQLLESVIRSAQPPPVALQSVSPCAAQEAVQALPTHVCGAVQALPQLPQLAESVARFTQLVPVVPHWVRFVAHVVPQVLAAQVWEEGQAIPQVPQLAGSEVVSAQYVVQFDHVDVAQAQAPATQVWLVESQTVPHAPQLAASLVVSTHALPQTA